MPTPPASHPRRRGLAEDRGSVAMAMMIVLIVTLLVVALLATAELGLRGSRRAGDSANALQLADAGINDATKAITSHTTSFTGASSLGSAGSYSYTATKDGNVWRLDSLGTDATGVRRRVLADAVDQPIFGNAFFGLTSVSLKGTADSYTGPSNPCSSDPASGVVGSNGTITFTGGGGTKNCRGGSGWNYAADGCSFNAQTAIPAGAVGSGACPPAPDSFTTTQKFNPPAVSVPSGLASEGPYTCATNGTIPSGTHLYTSVTLNHGCKVATTGTGEAVIYVTGPVTIGVGSGNCNNVVNAPPGACGSNFASFPSTWFQSGWTSKLQINVAGNGQVSFANNAIFWGVINAPNSLVTAAGGGTPQVDVFGSVLANSATSAAQFRFHYDQALKQQFSTGQYQITNWREEPVP
jgi:Tfp pilus assembly protein PilX